MFEKVSEKYAGKSTVSEHSVYYSVKKFSFKDGAIFGYTKGKKEAEAWCYPSKGQFPEKEMHCLVQWQDESISDAYIAIDGNGEAYLVGSKRFPKEIVAWKEIIPPKKEVV